MKYCDGWFREKCICGHTRSSHVGGNLACRQCGCAEFDWKRKPAHREDEKP